MNKDMYRRGSGPMWFVALAVVVFSMYSLAIAWSTEDKCDAIGAGKAWQVMPPHWECNHLRGFG